MGTLFAVLFNPAFPLARAEDCTLQRAAELPMVETGSLSPIVKVLVDGSPTNMLIDTGGAWSIVSPGLAARYKARPSTVDMRLGLGGVPLNKLVTLPSVELGVLKIDKVEFLVGPSMSGQVDGTLGANWLKQFDIEIDPTEKKVNFFGRDHCEGRVVYWPHQDISIVPLRIDPVSGWITIPVMLNGKELRALIDTGASETFLRESVAEDAFGLKPDSPGVTPSDKFLDRRGGEKQIYQYQFDTLELSGITFKNPRVQISQMELGGPDIILGMHHLAGLHLYFAYHERKLYATSAQGDLAERRATGASTTSPVAATDPVARINARDKLRDAEIAAKKQNFGDAAAAIEQAIKFDPNLSEAFLMRAALAGMMGRQEAALRDYAEAVRLDPQSAGPYLARARFYQATGDLDKALADSDRAVALAPSSDAALNNRCWIGAIAGRLDQARADCDAAINLSPHRASILDSRGFVHLKSGEPQLAIKDYDAALDIAPKSASSLWGRGLAEQQTGDKAAAADFAAAQAIDPDIAKHFGK